MPSEQMYSRSMRQQHLRDQQTDLSIAQHRDTFTLWDFHLIQNFASRRQRFNENGAFRGNGIGDSVQIANRKRQEFAKGTGMLHDPEHAPRRTMAFQTTAAPITRPTREIDLANHAPPHPFLAGIIGHGDHFAHEFVPWSSRKSVVSELQFQIGGADSTGQQPDARETFGQARQAFAANLDASQM
jgi:hypothetical protein